MRRYILIGLAALSLAACNQSTQQPTDSQAPGPATAAPVVEQVVAAPVFNPEFPEGLEPSFAYRIRSKNTEDGVDGRLRKLVIEFKEGDMASVDKQIEGLLVAKGYRRYKTFDQDGSLVGDYGKEGHRVTVTTTPADGKLMLDTDSLGTSYFVWNE